MAQYEISNEVRPLDRLITGFASSCGYEIQTVFNDLLRLVRVEVRKRCLRML
jgi:type I restriction enzyme M protein